MQPPKSSICVLCAIRPATTHDHVPPKGLFKGLEAQLITVPACSTCNNGSSSDDEDLRFFISVQIGKQTAGSAKLWNDGAHKSIKRKTKLREAVIASTRTVETMDNEGNCVERLGFEVPVRIYQTVFERTTRGLFFFHTGRILSPNTLVVVDMLRGQPELESPEIRSLTRNSIAGEACVYRFGIGEADSSFWLYEFYGAHWVMVRTGSFFEQ
ncbi:hypothetical protein [Sulfuritalea sp.]|uniref:hypothetical protein n=1 Tax=Sulfuritalea sp. TaxID=2480090 RepID=UPI001ACD1BD9|nr:hypothetical protein [Sulfuritalea sp.]MBN8476125.1 hypothetical protein [Sulfuritalea sp.]